MVNKMVRKIIFKHWKIYLIFLVIVFGLYFTKVYFEEKNNTNEPDKLENGKNIDKLLLMMFLKNVILIRYMFIIMVNMKLSE